MIRRFFFVLLLCPITISAATIRLTVQPPSPVADESFRLVFSTEESVDAEPEFDELEPLLEILQRNRQSSVQWINGKHTSSTNWVLDVIAKNPGKIVIPAVSFGQDRSDPLELVISENGAANQSEADLLLEIEVDNDSPYVQEQVILTARLLRRVELNDANLTDPSTDKDAIIKRLGSDSTSQVNRDGKRYEAFERRYSIFPQSSGTLTIPPMVLTTRVVAPSRSVFDPFRQAGKTRRVQSSALELRVKPIPPTYSGATWLPAKRLTLREDWTPNSAIIEAGEPLTRTVFLWAEGLNAGQLPEVPIALPAGLKSYPDQPQTSEQESAAGLTAIRQQKYAMIPNTDGSITFPETAISWWNTKTDTMEVARLEARTFNISPVTSAAPPRADDPNPNEPPVQTEPVDEPDFPSFAQQDTPTVAEQQNYQIAAIVFLLGWVLTAAAWWRQYRAAADDTEVIKSLSDAPETLKRARKDVLGACAANDAQGAKKALIRWGQLAFDDVSIKSLRALSRYLDEPMAETVLQLDNYLYGAEAGSWNASSVAGAVEEYEAPSALSDGRRRDKTLPGLFRLAS